MTKMPAPMIAPMPMSLARRGWLGFRDFVPLFRS